MDQELQKNDYRNSFEICSIRSSEYKAYAVEFEKKENPNEKELAKFYRALQFAFTHLASYYRELLCPIAGFEPPDINMCITYDHISKNHSELANRFEYLRTRQDEPNAEWYKHLENFHRSSAHAYKDVAAYYRDKSREQMASQIKKN